MSLREFVMEQQDQEHKKAEARRLLLLLTEQNRKEVLSKLEKDLSGRD